MRPMDKRFKGVKYKRYCVDEQESELSRLEVKAMIYT